MRLSEIENTPYLRRPNSPYALAIADYLRQNPGKTEEDFKRLLPNQQNRYLDKYLKEDYGRYYCSTDKKWKTRKSPKKSRSTNQS